MIGLARSSSSKPMPLSWARAAARAGPSTSWRELWRRSNAVVEAAMRGSEAYSGTAAARRRASRPLGVGRAGGAARGLRLAGAALGAGEPRALPLAEAPEVALGLAGIDLAARQVEVGLGDQPPLVALERHPLGQHVVGVGQAGGAVGAGLVRELDAVLVEQLAGLRQGGQDRVLGGGRGGG